MCFFILLLWSFFANAQTTITFVDASWPPYIIGNDLTGQATEGTAVELFNEIFKHIEGFDPVFTITPWNRALKEVESGQKDAISILQKTPEREQFLDYTDPIFSSYSVLFYSRKKFPKGIEWASLKDLIQYRIGVVSEYAASKHLAQARNNGVPLQLFPMVADDEQLFKMLEKDRLDLVAFNDVVGYELIRKLGLQGEILAVEKPLYTANFYMGFSKKLDHHHLITQINQVIRRLENNGEIERILSRQNR